MDAVGTSTEKARLKGNVVKYAKSSTALAKEAKSYEATYEYAERMHNQFSTTDAYCAIALAVAAVAALTNFLPLLFVAWFVGAYGMLAGIAGFLGWHSAMFGWRPEDFSGRRANISGRCRPCCG